MKKFILVPDSFKGSMSATTICAQMQRAILAQIPQAQIVSIPVADGGEGTVDCFVQAAHAQKRICSVTDPLGNEIESFYGVLPNGTAIIEMAAAAGLPLLGNAVDPMRASTFGVGSLIRFALDEGARHIVVGLGGSATTDGGTGAAAALGARFFDADGTAFVPTGGTLHHIATIDLSQMDPRIKQTTFTAMCDIDNPLYGPRGAAYVFAPQKGASAQQVSALDAGLSHLAQILEQQMGQHIADLPGAGAAGGMGAGLVAFFGARLCKGIDTVLDLVNFDTLLEGTDLVFTGEGKLDTQSLGGKVVLGVSRRAKVKNIPVVAVVGGVEQNLDAIYQQGVRAVFAINRMPQDFSLSRQFSEQNLLATMQDIMRLYLLR